MMKKLIAVLFILVWMLLLGSASPNGSSILTQLVDQKNWLAIATAFWFFGLLMGLTPCAIPLILIMTTIYGVTDQRITKTKTILLSQLYLIILSLSYAITGAIMAVVGSYFQAYLHNNIVRIGLVLLFILLGFSLLGLFYIKLPNKSLKPIIAPKKLSGLAIYPQVIYMGLVSTLIAAPCIIAPLLGVFTYVANKGDIQFGIISLFFTGIGFGTPVLAIYAIGTELLQSAGEWQVSIKHLFGIILVGIAIGLLDQLIHPNALMFLWAGLAIFTAIYMGVLNNDEKTAVPEEIEKVVCSLDGDEIPSKTALMKNIKAFKKMASILILLYGVLIFIGALLGNEDPFRPLKQTSAISISKKDI